MAGEESRRFHESDRCAAEAILADLLVFHTAFFPLPPILGANAPNFEYNSLLLRINPVLTWNGALSDDGLCGARTGAQRRSLKCVRRCGKL